ncbi:AAA family ATPase [Bdellovibrio sp. BCCA]|uniref:AAA family ATPase n=1 Tax=Bdellovibrio sp. BCCA TaxID=3136281 RepID=UPI0030F00FCB
MNRQKIIVCITGGPSSGKSGTAHSLTGYLKDCGVFAEISQEEFKNWVLEKRPFHPGDQSYVFEVQAKKERHLMASGVGAIVTDSPLMLGILYGRLNDPYEREFKVCELLLKKHHKIAKDHGYKVEHYFMIRRENDFEDEGRIHDLKQAKVIDSDCLALMNELGIKYKSVNGASDIIEDLKEKGLI